jgi:hypothetical protein
MARMADGRSEVAKNFTIDGFKGSVSFVTSMTSNFCGGCNRWGRPHSPGRPRLILRAQASSFSTRHLTCSYGHHMDLQSHTETTLCGTTTKHRDTPSGKMPKHSDTLSSTVTKHRDTLTGIKTLWSGGVSGIECLTDVDGYFISPGPYALASGVGGWQPEGVPVW